MSQDRSKPAQLTRWDVVCIASRALLELAHILLPAAAAANKAGMEQAGGVKHARGWACGSMRMTGQPGGDEVPASMLERLYKEFGFSDADQFHRMVASVDLSTQERLADFKDWQENDCTKEGLEDLIKEQKQSQDGSAE